MRIGSRVSTDTRFGADRPRSYPKSSQPPDQRAVRGASRSSPSPSPLRYRPLTRRPRRRCSGPPRASTTGDSAPTSTPPPARIRPLVPDEERRARGVLDTSVIIDLDTIDASQLPIEVAISAVTMAELAAGPHATSDPDERGRRQDRLQRSEAAFDPLPFDGDADRAYGRIFASVVAAGRKPRGARAVALLIAA